MKKNYIITNKGKEQKIPYTLVGSSSIPDTFGIVLTADGVKEIAKKMKSGEYLHIDIFGGYKATEFKITK